MSQEAEQIRRIRADLTALQRVVGSLNSVVSRGYKYQPCIFKLIEAFPKAGGKYKILILSGTSTAKLTGNLAMPEGFYVPTTDENAVGLNLAENGLSSHWLRTDGGAEHWLIGLCGGVLEDAKDPDPLEHTLVVFHATPIDAIFPVDVTKVGGTAGDQSTAASFTYDVKRRGGTDKIGTALSPVWNRPKGLTVEAGHGTAFYAADGTVVLYQVDEVPETAADCAGDGGGG